MIRKTALSQSIKTYRFIIILLFAALILHFAGGHFQKMGLPALLIFCIIFILIRLIKTARQHIVSTDQQLQPEPPPILHQVKKTVQESVKDVELSAIGTAYRRNRQLEFEKEIDTILDWCIKLIQSRIDCHTAALFFPTGDGGYKIRRHASKSECVNQEAIIYPGVGVIGSFLKEGLKQLKLTDIVTDSMTLFYYTKDAGIRSLMASPLIGHGTERGTIIVDSTEKDHFTDEDHGYLTAIAELCGQAVYNSYLYNQHKLDHERLAAMSNTEKYFFKEQHIEGVLDKLVEIIPFAFHCDRLSISLLKDTKDIAVIKRVWGQFTDNLIDLSFSIQEKSLANIVYTKSLSFLRNFSDDHYEIRHTEKEPCTDEFKSFLVYPLGVNACKGMILLESFQKNAYSERSRDLMSRLISSAGIAIEKIQILQQTENSAIRDGLTGLYNHRQFQHLLKESITRSIRQKKPLSLVVCDIDHFKKVNDTHGHQFGDIVLKAIALKLQSSIREGIDNAARYGGEEFALILSETDSRTAAETVERIRQQIGAMLFHDPKGKEMHITLSFGIAEYSRHAKNQELLISRADKALYRAKENGRNRAELYYDTNEEKK